MTGYVHQLVPALTTLALASRINLLITAVTLIACRAGTSRVVTLVDLGVGITKLDGDVSFQFVLESHSLDSRDSFYDRTLAYIEIEINPRTSGPNKRTHIVWRTYRERHGRLCQC